MRPKFCLLSLKIRGPQGRPYPRCTKVLKPAATQSYRCDPSDGTNRVPGTWFKNRNPCYREEPYETYFGDRYRAVRFNACTDRVSLGQTGHGPDRHPGRYDDPGPGRSWTRRRSYGSRRAWPSLRLGPRPRASLWLAPSLTPSSRETALADSNRSRASAAGFAHIGRRHSRRCGCRRPARGTRPAELV